MSQTVAEKAVGHITETAHQASRATSAVADGVGVVRRAAKQGGDAAEEFLSDTTERIQRHPALTVAATFAVGFTTGALIGWMMKRN